MDELDNFIMLKHGKIVLSDACWYSLPEEFRMKYYNTLERGWFLNNFVFDATYKEPNSVVRKLHENLRHYYGNMA